MAYYVQIQNNQIVDCSTSLLKNGINIEVSKEIFDDCSKNKNKYQPNETLDGIELNPNFEQEERQKELERIGNLTCTKRVFALMLQEMGISYTQLKELIATSEQAQLEWDLCVELERKNPLLDVMAGQLGVTSEQLDKLFLYANGEIIEDEFNN